LTTYRVVTIVEEGPTFSKPLTSILSELKIGGAIKLLSPLEYITDRQRRYYKGIVIPHMVKNDENGETAGWWDSEIKKLCKGLDYLKKEIFFLEGDDGKKTGIGRLTTVGVGKRNMSLFMEEIINQSNIRGWGIAAPDSNLRSK
jgi:hypothetical protein